MKRSAIRTLVFALAGAVLVLAVQWHISRYWGAYYSHYPFRGYEQAAKTGTIPPFLTTTARALLVTKVALCLLSLLTLWFAGSRLANWAMALLALWAGVMFSTMAIWIATPRLRQDSDMWPIDFIFLAIVTGFPLIAGGLVVLVVRTAIPSMRRKLL